MKEIVVNIKVDYMQKKKDEKVTKKKVKWLQISGGHHLQNTMN